MAAASQSGPTWLPRSGAGGYEARFGRGVINCVFTTGIGEPGNAARNDMKGTNTRFPHIGGSGLCGETPGSRSDHCAVVRTSGLPPGPKGAVMESTEILVVGDDGGTGEVRWPVVARVPPWITVFRANAESLRELSGGGRLAIARSPRGEITSMGDDAIVHRLDEGALLFIEAWKSGLTRKSPRRGDGRNWGDPEFRPPDQKPNGV